MFMQIRKRDGRLAPFDERKITEAIAAAVKAVGQEDGALALRLTGPVLRQLEDKFNGTIFGVEDVQDIVEKVLIEAGRAKAAKAYILYRDKRTRVRMAKSDLMDAVEQILIETNRENANISNSPSAKMLQIASAASKTYYLSRLITEEFSRAHKRGDIHIHDLDFYSKTLTCVQIPLGELLQRGFNNGHGYIRPPRRPASATAQAAIILQSSQNDMHGGQSFPFFDTDMAPFMEGADEEEVFQAMEALIYNLNSMHSRAGAQVPFSSINVGTDTSENARKVTRNLLLAYEKGLGHGENPIFPNVIFRLKEGVNLNPGDPNRDLFELAMRVTSRRMNPTYSFMDASFNKKFGTEVSYMGCRTRVIANRRGPEVTEKRGNLSFTSINLPRIAIQAKGDMDIFYRLLDNLMELTARQLFHRYRLQAALKVRDMPFLMGQHLYLGSENLKEGDSIEEAIKHGTLAIGFIGLAESLIALTGKHHGESTEANRLGHEIISYMRKKIDEFADVYDLNYTFLATPAEGLSGRFLYIDRREYGLIPGVTDKEYYTNSFHVPVDFPISIFNKIDIEGPYHKYCNAGHIGYIEMASPPLDNIEGVEAVLRHMKDSDMGYAGINFPIDFCLECHHQGVYPAECPSCGSECISRVRRITGYFSTIERFNDSKKRELEDRIPHL
ncbi:MAG: anaerobic ribonucleoside-triphosphate reductase [Clostridiales bacterium]|nr:anaerobic ribonucleoside-triphosphate reductase [Clostridiales bacterium]